MGAAARETPKRGRGTSHSLWRPVAECRSIVCCLELRRQASGSPRTGDERMIANDRNEKWSPLHPRAWAHVLGLVHVPMFGLGANSRMGDHSVLLDGEASSFALSVTDDSSLVYENDPLSWAWSANLRHSLIINQPSEEVFLRRWDGPSGAVRRFRLPKNPRAAVELLGILEKSPAPALEDVVLFVLRAFRKIRNSLPSLDGLDAIRVLNAVLLGTESVLRKQIRADDWVKSRTVQDAVRQLPEAQRNLAEVGDLSHGVLETFLGEWLFDHFLSPEPVSQCRLDPGLLLRHAAGQLYQEAHLQLEREAQMYLPGLAPDTAPTGLLTKDVRFTPPSLARVLAEQALDNAGDLVSGNGSLEILDPACGSGVFLQEVLRELVQRDYSGKLLLRGFDTSPISCAIARFCLKRATLDAPQIDVSIDIREEDSLRNEWGDPDVILMNPPFVPWDRMSPDDRGTVTGILGSVAKYRVDMAMAFVWRAARSLTETAVMASVLPAPLFETRSGQAWREALAADYDVLLLGRFEGYGFFRGSLVEPGILVLRRKTTPPSTASRHVRIVIAKSGHEDEAIRGLRQGVERATPANEWDAFSLQRSSIESASWMPRFRRAMQRTELLSAAGMTKVKDLFSVYQGILTGCNAAFVLSSRQLQSLPKRERAFFRPIASNSTIHDGVVSADEYVFYPYDASRPTITTEEELLKKARRYSERWLEPNRDKLASRRHVQFAQWWLLDRPRSWQMVDEPKLVSTYFGDRGSFAFDEEGSFVVLQGYAWLWRQDRADSADEDRIEFSETLLPWAYLCVLNSSIFEDLLESSCPRVQGGQFNLSARFVNRVYLPDLSNDLQVTGDLVGELAGLGRRIHAGEMPHLDRIDEAVARAYALPQ